MEPLTQHIPMVEADLVSEYLTMEEIVRRKLVLSPHLLKRRITADISTLVGKRNLTRAEIDSLAASIILYGAPKAYLTNNDWNYTPLPGFIRKLIIKDLLPEYTPVMINQLLNLEVEPDLSGSGEFSDAVVRMIAQYAIKHHLKMDYHLILNLAIDRNLRGLIQQILDQPDFRPTLQQLKLAIGSYNIEVAQALVDIMLPLERGLSHGGVVNTVMYSKLPELIEHLFQHKQAFRERNRPNIVVLTLGVSQRLIPAMVASPYFDPAKLSRCLVGESLDEFTVGSFRTLLEQPRVIEETPTQVWLDLINRVQTDESMPLAKRDKLITMFSSMVPSIR